MVLRRLFAVAAFASLAFVIYATLSPIGDRPHVGNFHYERFGAFGVVGLLFGLAYPHRTFVIVIVVLGSVAVLEALQLLTPDRDGAILDVVEKMSGGIAGIATAKLIAVLAPTKFLPRDDQG